MAEKQLRIVFMGTPDFAVPSLENIFQSQHQIIAVVTPPDKQSGRGLHVSACAVKKAAEKSDIPIAQPENLLDPEFVRWLNSAKPDLLVVVAFQILPPEIFTIPTKGTVNLHASLLPAYRGAAPIQRAIMNGEKETGVTSFFIEEKVDTGKILLQNKVQIGDNETFGELHNKLSQIGANLLRKTIDGIAANQITPKFQDASLASRAPKIKPKTCRIRWEKSAMEIHNKIRGLSPIPATFTFWGDKRIKIFRAQMAENSEKLSQGEWKIDNERWFVGCGDGAIEILEVQIEGKKRMTANHAVRGIKADGAQSFD